MALSTLIEVEDLEAWTGTQVSDLARAEAIIGAASTLVRSYTGRSWVDAGVVEPGVTDVQLSAVRAVVTIVAERVWSNPRGITQQATGPFSHSVSQWAAYGLALTDHDKALLPISAGSRPALWTQGTTRDDLTADTVFVPVVGTTSLFPFLTSEDIP